MITLKVHPSAIQYFIICNKNLLSASLAVQILLYVNNFIAILMFLFCKVSLCYNVIQKFIKLKIFYNY